MKKYVLKVLTDRRILKDDMYITSITKKGDLSFHENKNKALTINENTEKNLPETVIEMCKLGLIIKEEL